MKWRLILAVVVTAVVGVLGAVYSVKEIAHRQNHTAHVAKVAAAKSTKAAKTAAKTAVKAAAKTAKKVKTAQERFNDELVASQINGCKRGNVLRRTVNRDTLVIKQFMLLTAAQYAKLKTPFAQRRAAAYRTGAAKLQLVPLPHCARVVVRPSD